MKRIIATAAMALCASLALAGEAPKVDRLAQATPAPPTTSPPATPPSPGAPIAGENSFTEAQAKTHLEEAGFRNITDLKLGEDGIWRARAELGGVPAEVSLDYQGNITRR